MGSLVAEWARIASSPNGLASEKNETLKSFFEYVAAFWGWQKPGLITKYSKAGMGAWA